MNKLQEYGADEERFLEAREYPKLHLARIVSQYRDLYKAVGEEGEFYAEVSGKLRYEASFTLTLPAVGDYVMADRVSSEKGNAYIYKILKRRSVFERRAPEAENQTQIIAANIDRLFICMSLNNNFNLNRLERHLSAAYASGARVNVILTKADLCENFELKLAEAEKAATGAEITAVSSFDESSADRVKSMIKCGETVSFIGSSGVGKTTLINALLGEERFETAEIGRNDKGRHTTVNRQMIPLNNGSVLIDTPGMREFGVESADLSSTFADIDELASRCRFGDCTHTCEPGCAVLSAISEGTLDERRLASYNKLKREAKYDGLNSRQLEAEKLNEMFKDKGGMKKIREYNRKNNKRGKF